MTKVTPWKKFAGLAFGAACLLSSRAARADELALDAVIRAALDHGTKVQNSELNLKIAQAQLQQATGAFDWRANARAGWSHLYFPRAEQDGNYSVLTNNLDSSWDVAVTAGASKLFRDGIQVQPGITFYPGTSASSAQTFGLTRPQPSLDIQIPVLHAFDDDNPAAADERAARDNVAGNQFQNGAIRQQAVVDAVQTYWRCLAAQEEVKTLSANQDSSRAYTDSLRKLMEAGQIEPAVLDRALAKQAGKEGDLAKIREIEAACRVDLGVLLGRSPDMTLPTIDTAFPHMDELSGATTKLDEKALAEIAMRSRPDVQALEQDIAAASERLASARAGLDPKVDLDLNTTGVFVTVSKSLGADTEEGQVAAADANVSLARLNLTELQDQITRDISRGVSALRDSLATLMMQRRSEEALTKVVEDAQHGTQLGGMELADLQELEGERTDTEVELAEAELDTALNLAALRLATGTVVVDDRTASDENIARFHSLQFQ